MTVFSTLKPENTILNNVYLSYSFVKQAQVNVVKIEKGSNNISDLKLEFKIIANDGYKIDYENSSFEVDLRTLQLEDLPTLTEPTDDDLLKIDLNEFATAKPIGVFNSRLVSKDDNFTNFDTTKFKTIKKKVDTINDYGESSSITYYVVLIDPKDSSCMIGIYLDGVGTGSIFSVKNSANKSIAKPGMSLTQIFINDYGETSNDTFFAVHKINFNAKSSGVTPDPPLNKNIFTTYVVDPTTLTGITAKQDIYNEIIINTVSYPLKFKADDLTETTLKLANETTSHKGKTFIKNNAKIEIFKFTIPTFGNVEQCALNLPFNNSIFLNYEDLENKTITGYLNYEMLTSSTTLIITNGDHNIYKGSFDIGSDLPYKPTGDFANYSKTETRLANDPPLLIIKCSQIIRQNNFIKGTIKSEITGILKNELELLNTLTEQGVIVDE